MGKMISFFNHKGGVGKTTLLYNLAWKLTEKNKKILLIDADPQQNLTAFVNGFNNESKEKDLLDTFTNYEDFQKKYLNIYEYFQPRLFLHAKNNVSKKELYEKKFDDYSKSFFLLSGDINLSKYDIEFSTAIQSNSESSKHLPSSFGEALKEISKKFDYTLIDMSPNLGMLNMFLLMSSDYFLVPVNPSFFCYQALTNLQSIMKDWDQKINIYRPDQFNKESTFKALPQFLGIVSQNFRPRENSDGGVVGSFKIWEDKINDSAIELYETLEKIKMTISKERFQELFPNSTPFLIDRIPDFNKLKVISEELGKPIFYLTKSELNKNGINQEHYTDQITSLESSLENISNGIIRL